MRTANALAGRARPSQMRDLPPWPSDPREMTGWHDHSNGSTGRIRRHQKRKRNSMHCPTDRTRGDGCVEVEVWPAGLATRLQKHTPQLVADVANSEDPAPPPSPGSATLPGRARRPRKRQLLCANHQSARILWHIERSACRSPRRQPKQPRKAGPVSMLVGAISRASGTLGVRQRSASRPAINLACANAVTDVGRGQG